MVRMTNKETGNLSMPTYNRICKQNLIFSYSFFLLIQNALTHLLVLPSTKHILILTQIPFCGTKQALNDMAMIINNMNVAGDDILKDSS